MSFAPQKVFICGAGRSPVGAICGSLSEILPLQLATTVMSSVLKTSKINPKLIEYTYLAWALQDPRSTNPAKSASELCGVPCTSPGTTVQENCASGGAAMHCLVRSLRLNDVSIGIAAGVESPSNVARYLYTGRFKGQQYGDLVLADGLMGGLTDTNVGPKGELMGLLTERVVLKYGVSRGLQDEIAHRSHHNACNAWDKGFFNFVTPIEVAKGKTKKLFVRDENPRRVTMEELMSARPYFNPKSGTITSLNSSSLNDAAAAVVLANEDGLKKGGLTPLAEIVSVGNIGVDREYMGEGAFLVLPKIFESAGIDFADVDFFDMNEAFAAVVGGALNHFKGKLNIEKVNQWGSGISIGHPIAATGVRQVVDMVHNLKQRGKSVGVTSRCVGGGIGSGEVIRLV